MVGNVEWNVLVMDGCFAGHYLASEMHAAVSRFFSGGWKSKNLLTRTVC
jgi:hypothetical protein